MMTRTAMLVTAALLSGPQAIGQDLADYFGFDGLEVVKIDRGAGPIMLGDVDGDGLTDLIVVNNRKSRIEIHYQKRDASPDDAMPPPSRPNEFPEHWRFRREFIVVNHDIGALVVHDFDADGLNDLIFVGRPSEIVFVHQRAPGVFEIGRRRRVKGLTANKDSLAVADMIGDKQPELITIAEGRIIIWRMRGNLLERAETLAGGDDMVAFWVADYDGNGRMDLAAALPDDAAPIRLWLGANENGGGAIGPQLRFEMPPIVEAEPVHLPGERAAQLAVIERPSKRLVVLRVVRESVQQSGDRDASMRIHGFADAGNRTREVIVADIDGDGLLDLIATDTEASALVVYRQVAGHGLERGESHPAFADITAIAAGNVDDDPFAELFVLSEKESVVGRSDLTESLVPYPRPIPIPEGKTPVAMSLVGIDGQPRLAVVLKDGREYSVAIIHMNGDVETIELGSSSRSPDAIVGLDADQDGRTDLLLLTRDKPMQMLQRGEEGFVLRESKDMGQFGLVKAATSGNTTVFDIDHDGIDELLIADRNFIRAVRYVPQPPPGISAGWQVVVQINADEPDSDLVAVTVLDDLIVAADRRNDRLIMFGEDKDAAAGWSTRESLRVAGFKFSEIHTGSFSGDGEPNILAIGDEGFAVIRLAGEHITLQETNSWRTNVERRFEHELTAGDVNGDGRVDLVSLDAGEQMLEIFTFTEAHNLLYAMGFQIFESRIFSGGESREFEPSQSLIGDITGDGADDVILLVHDRVLIYPQMTKAKARDGAPE